MDTPIYVLLSLLAFTLFLAVLNIGFIVWSKIIPICLILLSYAKFKFKQLIESIRSFFSKKKETPSNFEPLGLSDLETLLDSTQPNKTAPPLSTPRKSNHPKLSKDTSAIKPKRDSKGKFTKK